MKEGFLHNKLNKIKNGVVIGSAVVSSFLPMNGNSTEVSSINGDKNKTEISKENIQKTITETINFKDFNPTPNKKIIKIKDGKLKAYVMDNYSLAEISDDKLPKNESKWKGIKNFKGFKEEVLKVTQDLGYSEDEVKNLSIHDAVMLCGNILAKKLSYNYNMIDEKDDSLNSPLNNLYNIFEEVSNNIDTRNEEAKRIDNLFCDQIFLEGNGICRNYAAVNKAIFEVLKTINSNLNNVYMKWYSSSSLGESIALPHAWNQVISVSGEDNNLKLLITYVDPTWLDTKITKANALGIQANINEEEIYNAFDSNHFFSGCLSAHIEIAKLYELLGSNQRLFNLDKRFDSKDSGFNDNESINYYRELSYHQRINICKIALDSARNVSIENTKKRDALFDKFEVSILEAISNLQECPVGYSSLLGPTYFEYFDLEFCKRFTLNRFEEIKNILKEGENVFSQNLDQTIRMVSFDGEGEKMEQKEQVIKFFSISDRLNKTFNKKNN